MPFGLSLAQAPAKLTRVRYLMLRTGAVLWINEWFALSWPHPRRHSCVGPLISTALLPSVLTPSVMLGPAPAPLANCWTSGGPDMNTSKRLARAVDRCRSRFGSEGSHARTMDQAAPSPLRLLRLALAAFDHGAISLPIIHGRRRMGRGSRCAVTMGNLSRCGSCCSSARGLQ